MKGRERRRRGTTRHRTGGTVPHRPRETRAACGCAGRSFVRRHGERTLWLACPGPRPGQLITGADAGTRAGSGRVEVRARSPTRSARWSASSRDSRSGPSRRASGQARLAQSGAGHAGGVDRIALATASGAAAGLCHERRRYAHAALAGGDEEALKAARDVATVFDGEATLRTAGEHGSVGAS